MHHEMMTNPGQNIGYAMSSHHTNITAASTSSTRLIKDTRLCGIQPIHYHRYQYVQQSPLAFQPKS
jgi:hypothetical protein